MPLLPGQWWYAVTVTIDIVTHIVGRGKARTPTPKRQIIVIAIFRMVFPQC